MKLFVSIVVSVLILLFQGCAKRTLSPSEAKDLRYNLPSNWKPLVYQEFWKQGIPAHYILNLASPREDCFNLMLIGNKCVWSGKALVETTPLLLRIKNERRGTKKLISTHIFKYKIDKDGTVYTQNVKGSRKLSSHW